MNFELFTFDPAEGLVEHRRRGILQTEDAVRVLLQFAVRFDDLSVADAKRDLLPFGGPFDLVGPYRGDLVAFPGSDERAPGDASVEVVAYGSG